LRVSRKRGCVLRVSRKRGCVLRVSKTRGCVLRVSKKRGCVLRVSKKYGCVLQMSGGQSQSLSCDSSKVDNPHASIRTGYYRGVVVAVKKLNRTGIVLTRADLILLNAVSP
jgi:hypothetical protein